jgi:hypothetical protein
MKTSRAHSGELVISYALYRFAHPLYDFQVQFNKNGFPLHTTGAPSKHYIPNMSSYVKQMACSTFLGASPNEIAPTHNMADMDKVSPRLNGPRIQRGWQRLESVFGT